MSLVAVVCRVVSRLSLIFGRSAGEGFEDVSEPLPDAVPEGALEPPAVELLESFWEEQPLKLVPNAKAAASIAARNLFFISFPLFFYI